MYVTPNFYGVYLLKSTVKNAYYIGSTPDPQRRLRQHNGEISSGAFRTKRKGYRPWEMVIIIYGFPSKVQALQFEHAWQHAYQSRHIDGLGNKTNHSIHYRLGNLRKLLSSDYFKRLILEVNIFNREIEKIWDVNKFGCCHYQISTISWHDFIPSLTNDEQFDIIKREFLRIVKCKKCDKDIDMVNNPQLVTKCVHFYHLKCLCNDFLPSTITVDDQSYHWRDLIKISTKLRNYFNQ
ncbi:structure-specific endonuclease subunit Slx1p [[Candida] jaroonii]|uniref:Structure-specific endonuclease subunit Slx1p n=1 Tax=[Candida] jaroonii TaxID=467808 RepID=A0ACA9YB49_9ASCO|nr:structure-specific endonuclease subunit Slx1p [[Candida] jaroonii]